MERQHRQVLRRCVHHQREHAVPRSRTVRRVTLLAVVQGRRVAMVPVRHQERLRREPCGDRGIGRDRPHAMADALLVDDRVGRRRAREPVQELRERRARPRHGPVDGREMRAGGPQQAEPVLDGPGHGVLVGDHTVTPGLQLHGYHESADLALDAIEVELHLVGVVRRVGGAPERAAGLPVPEQVCRPRVAAPRVGRVLRALGQVEVHHAERARLEIGAATGVADNVVRRRRHPLERAGHSRIEDETSERGDARHAPCIAAAPSPRPRTTSTSAASACSRRGIRTRPPRC